MDIRVIDSNFAHANCCSNGNLKVFPKYFNWYRGSDTKDITIFVDNEWSKVKQTQGRVKIWMLLEPPTIAPQVYQLARNPEIQDLFDYILTFDRGLVKSNPNKFVWYPLGGCWIEPSERKVYPKSKNISIIASEKNFTEGHKLRHKLIQSFGNKIDVFGRGYRYINSKLEALKDYRFTIVIENCQLDDYFSEKIIDATMTGTIPIYWGSPNIHRHLQPFDNLGIISDYLIREEAVPGFMQHLYHDCLDIVHKNFDDSQIYTNTEDWLWLNFLSKLCITTPQT